MHIYDAQEISCSVVADSGPVRRNDPVEARQAFFQNLRTTGLVEMEEAHFRQGVKESAGSEIPHVATGGGRMVPASDLLDDGGVSSIWILSVSRRWYQSRQTNGANSSLSYWSTHAARISLLR